MTGFDVLEKENEITSHELQVSSSSFIEKGSKPWFTAVAADHAVK